jgi:hypothetical protein
MPELTTAYSIVTFDEKERDRWRACIKACEGLNPEVVPELVDCLKSLYASHQELLERCLLHDAFLNHAQQLGAGADAIRAKELLHRIKQ